MLSYVKCGRERCGECVCYAEEIVATQMLSGLSNMEHQCRVLSEAPPLERPQAKYRKLVAPKTTDTSTKQLHGAGAIQPKSSKVAQKSEYKKEKDHTKACKGCGRSSHAGKAVLLRNECPAFNMTCHNCGIKGHLKAVCRRQRDQGKQGQDRTKTSATREPFDEEDDELSYMFHLFDSGSGDTKQQARAERKQRQRQRKLREKEREAERLEKNLTNGFIRACAVPTIR